MKASPMFNCLPGTMLSWRRMHEWSLGRSCGRALLNDTADLAASHRLFNPVQRWPRFLPIKVLSRVFRGKFVAGLRSAFLTGTLQFHGSLLPLAEPRAFAAWLRVLFRHDWVVYSKKPFGGPEHVLRYLGAYTHRVAISNHRLVSLADGQVTFRWRDSAHK